MASRLGPVKRLLKSASRSEGARDRRPGDSPDRAERERLGEQLATLADAVTDQGKILSGLRRQLAELSGLFHQQAGYTTEALGRAGWQSKDETEQQRALQKALHPLAGEKTLIVGPWTGEVGFELMYWIPFVNWLKKTRELNGERMVVISRGGVSAWYRHITSRYVDILDHTSAADFRDRTAGPKKQRGRRGFDEELIGRVTAAERLDEPEVLHPSVMYRLFVGLWRKRATLDSVEAFTAYQTLAPLVPEPLAGVPDGYVVVKFYFSKCFPENAKNRAFVSELMRKISRQVPVVLLASAVQVDDHSDYLQSSGSGVYVVDPFHAPQNNLERQTRIITGARGLIGTYGGFSYLAPFCGVRSLSFFSERLGFESHHLELAQRVFSKLQPGGFVALDRRDLDMVEPALDRWTRAPAAPAVATS